MLPNVTNYSPVIHTNGYSTVLPEISSKQRFASSTTVKDSICFKVESDSKQTLATRVVEMIKKIAQVQQGIMKEVTGLLVQEHDIYEPLPIKPRQQLLLEDGLIATIHNEYDIWGEYSVYVTRPNEGTPAPVH